MEVTVEVLRRMSIMANINHRQIDCVFKRLVQANNKDTFKRRNAMRGMPLSPVDFTYLEMHIAFQCNAVIMTLEDM